MSILNGTTADDTLNLVTGVIGIYGYSGNDTIVVHTVVAGAVLDGGDGTDILKMKGNHNLSLLALTNFEVLNMFGGYITLRADQLASFNTITSAHVLNAAEPGTYDLSNISMNETIQLYGSTGDDILIAGDMTSKIGGGGGNDIIYGRDAGTLINTSSDGTSTVYGGQGGDSIFANGKGDTIHSGGGNDTITLHKYSAQETTVDAGSGDDLVILYNVFDADVLDGGDGIDTLQTKGNLDLSKLTFSNFEVLNMFGGYITLRADQLASFNTITSAHVLNAASAGTYDLSRIQTYNNIYLYGSAGNDTLIAGNTTQRLSGGLGDDVLVLSETCGQINGGKGVDTLKIITHKTDLNQLDHNSVEIIDLNYRSVIVSGETLASFSGVIGYGKIYASEVGTYDLSDKNVDNSVSLYGSSGDDTLIAGESTSYSVLDGGAGNDILIGTGGHRSYFFGDGYGNDMVNNYHIATNVSSALAIKAFAADISVVRSGENLVLKLDDTGEILTIQNYFTSLEYRVDQVHFSDFITIDLEVIAFGNNDILLGSFADDTLAATADTTHIYSGYGNDKVTTGASTVYVSTGLGNDVIELDASIISGEIDGWSGTDTLKADGYDISNLTLTQMEILDMNSGCVTINASQLNSFNTIVNSGLLHAAGADRYDLSRVDVSGTRPLSFHGSSENDVIIGSTSTDFIHGNTGADKFTFVTDTAFINIDTIQDFNLSQGDALDVSSLLTGYNPSYHAITDFIQISDEGTHSYLSVDVDGGGDNFIQVVELIGVTGLTDEAALETSGSLITT